MIIIIIFGIIFFVIEIIIISKMDFKEKVLLKDYKGDVLCWL